MDENNNFERRYETENFIVKVERPHFGDKDTDVIAKLYGKYKESDTNDPYFAEHKLSTRQIKTFGKAVCKSENLDPDETPTENTEKTFLQEIETLLLGKKSEISQLAKDRNEYLRENYSMDDDSEEDAKKTMLNQALKKIYKADAPTVDDFTDIRNFNEFQEANQDLILRQGENLMLTQKGQRKAEDLLDITKIEDVEGEAEDVLEEGFLEYYLDAIDEVHKGDEALKIWELISALSAKCSERQIDSWAVGPSGKGKSHIKRAIVKFLPEDSYEAPNSMTPKAMLYKTQKDGSDFFKGKLLFLDEADGYDSDDAIVLLRGLTDPDEDVFTHDIVKDQNYEQLIIEKPITVWFTSVESIADEQLKNRFILTNPDGSEELDNTVFKHQQWKLHTGQELGRPPAESEVVKECISKIRGNTAGLTPIVPFEVDWKQKFNRRLYPYFVTLMELVAKINYKNRVIKQNYIYVTQADFHTAALIWSSLIDTTIAQTDTEALKLIMELPNEKREAMRTTELAKRLEGFNIDKVRRKAEALRETEELQLINAKKEGGQWEYWAGKDKDRLINPEPEIKADPETMSDIMEHTELGADELVVENVTSSTVPVYDRLKELQDEIRQEKMDEVNEWTVELEQEDKKMLKLLESLDFSTDLQFVVSSFEKNKDEAWDILERLEKDHGLINLYDEDGSQKARKTRTYSELREEGKITL